MVRPQSSSFLRMESYDMPPPPMSSDSTLAEDNSYQMQDLEKGRKSSAQQEKKFDTKLRDVVPIVYQTMTFETEVPDLPWAATDDPEARAALQPPDVRKLISPYMWPDSRKQFTMGLALVATVFSGFSAGAYSGGSIQLAKHFGVGSVPVSLGTTTFCVGFALCPMVLAPLSEVGGRRPVFLATGVIWFITQICCAVTPTFGGLLVSRFFVGAASSTFSTMIGGVVSDMYGSSTRNTPMALFSGCVIFGTGLGPLLALQISQRVYWRWIFWCQVIADGILLVVVIFWMEETRGSVLLSKKAKIFNDWYDARERAGYAGLYMSAPGERRPERVRWRTPADDNKKPLTELMIAACVGPFKLLFTESVVFFFSVWISFAWAVLYCCFAAIPLVFATRYKFDQAQCGAVFSSICVGTLIATWLNIYQDKAAKKRNKLPPTPENRLYFSCIESTLLAIGLFMFGWTCFSSIHWIVPCIGLAIASMGIFSIYLACFNYLADAYCTQASTALAAQSFCRNMLAGAFPLFTDQMFKGLTFGGAGSLLGAFGALLSVVPWVLVFYGPKIRQKSNNAV